MVYQQINSIIRQNALVKVHFPACLCNLKERIFISVYGGESGSVHMCACVYVRICVRAYMYVFVCVCVCTYLCACVYVRICRRAYMYVFVCVRICTYLWACVYVHICVNICVPHVCVCVHISVRIHTQKVFLLFAKKNSPCVYDKIS